MIWLGSQVAVSCQGCADIPVPFRPAGLKCLGQLALTLASLLIRRATCTFPNICLAKDKCCKPCLYGILFENKNKLSKKCSPKARF